MDHLLSTPAPRPVQKKSKEQTITDGSTRKNAKDESKEEVFPYPCTRTHEHRRSHMFDGPLIPTCFYSPSRTLNMKLMDNTVKSRTEASVSLYTCWLCSASNEVQRSESQFQKCNSCARLRFPTWSLDEDRQPILCGDVIRFGEEYDSGIDPKHRRHGATKEVAFITCVDYGKRRLEAVTRRVLNGKGAASTLRLRRETIPMEQLSTRRVLVLNFPMHRVQALSFRNVLLCGNCGNLADLSGSELEISPREGKVAEEPNKVMLDECHRDILVTPIETEDRKGQLRLLSDKVEEANNEALYLKRKWTTSKHGYSDYAEAEKRWLALQAKEKALIKACEPVELWCPFCEWKWQGMDALAVRLEAESENTTAAV